MDDGRYFYKCPVSLLWVRRIHANGRSVMLRAIVSTFAYSLTWTSNTFHSKCGINARLIPFPFCFVLFFRPQCSKSKRKSLADEMCRAWALVCRTDFVWYRGSKGHTVQSKQHDYKRIHIRRIIEHSALLCLMSFLLLVSLSLSLTLSVALSLCSFHYNTWCHSTSRNTCTASSLCLLWTEKYINTCLFLMCVCVLVYT